MGLASYDGWTKNLVVEIDSGGSDLDADVFARLYEYLFHTSYKAAIAVLSDLGALWSYSQNIRMRPRSCTTGCSFRWLCTPKRIGSNCDQAD